MKNAIVIGASSGIGRQLAVELSTLGYRVGLTGRRTALLEELAASLPGPSRVATLDLSLPEAARRQLALLFEQLEDVDLVVINAGTGSMAPDFPLEDELATIAVNVSGFTLAANLSYHYFLKRGRGHIVGISSIMALRGGPAPAYNASKAYVSSYLEGLACKLMRSEADICLTDVRPGFVDTAMARGDGLFWVASVDKAARQILRAIRQRRRVVYVTRRWRLVAWLLTWLPAPLYRRLYR